MSLEQQLQELINLLRGAVKDGSIAAGQERLTKSYNELNKSVSEQKVQAEKLKKAQQEIEKDSWQTFKTFKGRMKEFSADILTHSQLLSSAFTDAADKLDYSNFELLPKAFQKELEKTGSAAAKQLGKFAQDSNIYELNDTIDVLAETLSEWDKTGTLTLEQVRRLGEVSDKTGISVEHLTENFDVLKKTVEDANKARAELTRKMRGGFLGDFSNITKKVGKVLGVAVGGMAKTLSEAARPALRFGTNITDSLDAFMAGMNPEEMAQNVAEFRQSINASGLGMDGFREVTEKGSLALVGYTGDLRDAVRVQSSALDQAQRFGAQSRSQIKSFMDQQVSSFKKFNSVFSMTAEEFVEMNKQIQSSQSVNEQIYRLNRKQRVQYAQEVQQTVLRLRTFGLMQDQAMKVVDAMSAIGAKSPKERLKQAAKLQAVGGALGFGQEAKEMAKLMRGGMRGKGEMERFAELQQKAQTAVGQKMGEGFASELMTAQMLETTGLEDLLGPKSDFAALNTEQYKSISNVEKHAVKRNELLAKAVGLMDMTQKALMGPIATGIGTIVAAIAVKSAGGAMGGAISSLLGGTGLRAIFGTILRFLGPVGILSSIAVAAAGAVYAANAKEQKTTGEKRRERANAAFNTKLAKEAENILSETRKKFKGENLRPEEVTKSYLGFMPSKSYRTSEGDIEQSEYAQLSTAGQRSIDITAAIDKLRIMQTEALTKQTEANKEQTEEQLALLKKSIEELTEMKNKLDHPDEAVRDAIEKQTKQQKDIADDEANRSKKNSRLIWSRVTAQQGGAG